MKSYRQARGFTLIEVAFVMAIIAILVVVSAGSLLRMQPVNRVRRDSWQLYMTVTKARMLSINEGRPYGVVLLKGNTTFPEPCQTTDCYFIFRDWESDGKYKHPAGQPLAHTCLPWIASGSTCNEDPIMGKILYRTKILDPDTHQPLAFANYLATYLADYQAKGGDIFPLDNKTFFATVLGTDFTQPGGGEVKVVITFNNLGGIVQASNINDNNIFIQSKSPSAETTTTPQGGVQINVGSGITTRRKITMEPYSQ